MNVPISDPKSDQRMKDLLAILTEFKEATDKHGNFVSAHEMYGVLQE